MNPIRRRLHEANLAVLHLTSANRPADLAAARLGLEDAKAAFDASIRTGTERNPS